MFPSFSAFCLVSKARCITQGGQGDIARAHPMRTYGLTPQERKASRVGVHTSAAGLFCAWNGLNQVAKLTGRRRLSGHTHFAPPATGGAASAYGDPSRNLEACSMIPAS